MDEFISKHEAYKMLKDKQAAYMQVAVNEAFGTAARMIDQMKPADVQPVSRWININDKLPEIGKSVLIYYPKWDGDEIQVAKLDGDGMTFDICGEFNIGTGVVTHWMPLPEPPKGGDAE